VTKHKRSFSFGVVSIVAVTAVFSACEPSDSSAQNVPTLSETTLDSRLVGKWLISDNRDYNPQIVNWELRATGGGAIRMLFSAESDEFEEVSWWTRRRWDNEPPELCLNWILRQENGESTEQISCWPYSFSDENTVELQDLSDYRLIMVRSGS